MPRRRPGAEPTKISIIAAEPRARVEVSVGMLAPRVVARGASTATVAIAAAQMLLLDGDDLAIEVSVGSGCSLDIEDVGGTVAYPGSSTWRLDARIGENATLVWRGLPFVVTEDASLSRSTQFTLARGAALLSRETLVLGRHGEVGGSIVSETSIRDPDGAVLVERLEADATTPDVGVLGKHRVLDCVIAAGFAPPATPDTLELEAPGGIARYLGDETHLSPLGDVMPRWHEELAAIRSR